MNYSLEYRDLYAYYKGRSEWVCIKKAPFLWDDEIHNKLQGVDFELRNPIKSLKPIAEFRELNWSKYHRRRLKPVLAHCLKAYKWAMGMSCSIDDIILMLQREIDMFHTGFRFPYDSLTGVKNG